MYECTVLVMVYYPNYYLVYYPNCYFLLSEAQAQECTEEEACLYFADVGRQGVFSMPVSGGPHTRVPVSGGLVAPRGVAFDPSTDTLFITNLAFSRYITKYSEDSKEKTQRYKLPGKSITLKTDLLFHTSLGRLGETSKFPFCDHKQTTKNDNCR